MLTIRHFSIDSNPEHIFVKFFWECLKTDPSLFSINTEIAEEQIWKKPRKLHQRISACKTSTKYKKISNSTLSVKKSLLKIDLFADLYFTLHFNLLFPHLSRSFYPFTSIPFHLDHHHLWAIVVALLDQKNFERIMI